ncbi:MAG: hypothetical protein FJ095_02230 [Deltaproteobacteria bacterium]|nr:hypothetical protein [Deltaproteobacteria bacterium]
MPSEQPGGGGGEPVDELLGAVAVRTSSGALVSSVARDSPLEHPSPRSEVSAATSEAPT